MAADTGRQSGSGRTDRLIGLLIDGLRYGAPGVDRSLIGQQLVQLRRSVRPVSAPARPNRNRTVCPPEWSSQISDSPYSSGSRTWAARMCPTALAGARRRRTRAAGRRAWS